jgi:thiamine-phosphate pyrophosphorylase
MPSVLRIIDANANRAREALRVMEEAARFILNDEPLCRSLKGLRHDFSQTIAGVPGLEASRDTPGDVGASISTVSEQSRGSAAEVVIAAGKRLSESLRAIEEYGKTLGDSIGAAGFASVIERLRYAGYDIEQRLNRAMGSGLRKQWRLCVLLTDALCKNESDPARSWRSVLEHALDAGADCIQLREKSMDAGWLLERAKQVVSISAGRASVIINDRPDVALLAGANGVHLGQTDLPCAEVRRIVGRQLIVGVSASNLEQAKRAMQDGADYCGVGPMFATTTKHKDVIVGPAYLREYLAWDGLPHLAIGGITPSNVGELRTAGARGIAVSSAVCAAKDPGAAAHALL